MSDLLSETSELYNAGSYGVQAMARTYHCHFNLNLKLKPKAVPAQAVWPYRRALGRKNLSRSSLNAQVNVLRCPLHSPDIFKPRKGAKCPGSVKEPAGFQLQDPSYPGQLRAVTRANMSS